MKRRRTCKPFECDLTLLSKAIKAISDQLNRRQNLKLVAINSGWLIGDKILRMLIGLFVGAWVARYLGPDQYGKLAYVVAFLAIFQAFSVLGLDSIIVRDIAQKTAIPNRILGTALVLRFLASALCFSAACFTIYILHPGGDELLLLVMFVGLGIIFQVADIVDLWFQSQSQSRRTVTAKATSYVFVAAVKIGLILKSAPLWAFAAAQGIETVVSAIALYIAYKKYSVFEKWEWSLVVAKKMLRQSWPLLLSSLLIIIYMRSSQLFIKEFVDSSSVGIYSAAQVLSELWYFLPMTITASVAPVIARKKAEGEIVYIKALQHLFSMMWLISILISVSIALLSGYLVTALYGEAYRSSANILSIHIFTLIPVCFGVAQSIWLINENRSSLAIYQALAGAVSSVGLNFILIPNYGIIGAAIATVVSQFIQAFAVNALFAPQVLRIQARALVVLVSTIWQTILHIIQKKESK